MQCKSIDYYDLALNEGKIVGCEIIKKYSIVPLLLFWTNDNFDDILKGELSAIRAYEQAKVAFNSPEMQRMDQFQNDHKQSQFDVYPSISAICIQCK